MKVEAAEDRDLEALRLETADFPGKKGFFPRKEMSGNDNGRKVEIVCKNLLAGGEFCPLAFLF